MSEVHASVLIPVKNGGALLGEVLDRVLSQRTTWRFEVLVVDSGSQDDSVKLVRSRNVPCHCIPSNEFGHGRTRNLLASQSSGKFLVFITQDALPVDEHWLQKLVEACEQAPDVAGSFGPHRAYPHARLITQKELHLHFAGFGVVPSVVRIDDPERFKNDVGYRQWLHFFSSNNACLRRTVWEKIPLPDVSFAEDQSWALQAVKAGYGKGYAPDAVVYHSHDFGALDTFRRNFDESRSFAVYFGYRLQSGFFQSLRSVAALVARDWRWLREVNFTGIQLYRHAVVSVANECARVFGQYLGTKHDRMPRMIAHLLSRDELLQRRRG